MPVASCACCAASQDNPLPWVVGDPRLMNPGIHVGSQLDRLVEGGVLCLSVLLSGTAAGNCLQCCLVRTFTTPTNRLTGRFLHSSLMNQFSQEPGPLSASRTFLLTWLVCMHACCSITAGQPAMLVVVLNTFRYSRYLLVPERNAIHLVLHAEAQPRDMVQAYLQVRCPPVTIHCTVHPLAWLGVRIGCLCACPVP